MGSWGRDAQRRARRLTSPETLNGVQGPAPAAAMTSGGGGLERARDPPWPWSAAAHQRGLCGHHGAAPPSPSRGRSPFPQGPTPSTPSLSAHSGSGFRRSSPGEGVVRGTAQTWVRLTETPSLTPDALQEGGWAPPPTRPQPSGGPRATGRPGCHSDPRPHHQGPASPHVPRRDPHAHPRAWARPSACRPHPGTQPKREHGLGGHEHPRSHTCTRTLMPLTLIHTLAHAHTHTRAHAHARTHSHTRTRSHTHTLAHARALTHARSHSHTTRRAP